MGASGSKKHSKHSQRLRERLLRAHGVGYVGQYNVLGEEFSQSQEESGREQKSPSCEGQQYQQGELVNTPAIEGQKNSYKQQNIDDADSDDDLVGVPVTSRVPTRAMTYKLAIDMSHFIKEKGGLEGMFYSHDRHRILDLYLEEFGYKSGLPEKEWKAKLKARGIPYS
uniref:Protein Nef n=1 Tax=Human immunodeficiency virus 2 TaxID=11709 RepID=O57049_9HIV2|nr:nef protein [Human immunodeficiency virus 2]